MLNSFYDKFIFTNGLKYKHNNFYLINLPFVILPVDVLIGIAEVNDSKLNKEIYYAIKNSIKGSLNKEFQIDFGISGDKGLEFMETYFTASGWGKLQRTNLDFEKNRALISVENSPVAINSTKAKLHADSFIRGFLAGIFSIYFKKDVECVEVKCKALGETHCDFIVKPIEEFNFEKKLVREQLKVE
ncbi:MAG: V4R domain-containing protein [Candidatus Diapherotrites archaeon]